MGYLLVTINSDYSRIYKLGIYISYKGKNWLILSEDVKVVKSKKRLRNGIKLKDQRDLTTSCSE